MALAAPSISTLRLNGKVIDLPTPLPSGDPSQAIAMNKVSRKITGVQEIKKSVGRGSYTDLSFEDLGAHYFDVVVDTSRHTADNPGHPVMLDLVHIDNLFKLVDAFAKFEKKGQIPQAARAIYTNLTKDSKYREAAFYRDYEQLSILLKDYNTKIRALVHTIEESALVQFIFRKINEVFNGTDLVKDPWMRELITAFGAPISITPIIAREEVRGLGADSSSFGLSGAAGGAGVASSTGASATAFASVSDTASSTATHTASSVSNKI